jgi:phosphoglycerate dehydrogenase-like enzyme
MPIVSAEGLVIGLPFFMKRYLEGRLPAGAEIRWLRGASDSMEQAPGIEIGWFDLVDDNRVETIYARANALRWVNTASAGVDHLPLSMLEARGIRMTNGAGVNAAVVADYAVMGVLVAAKRFDQVVRAQDRAEWLTVSPGTIELDGARALVIGYGKVGRAIARRLKAFGVTVDVVRNNPEPGSHQMSPQEWRARVGDYDFLLVAAPSTANTHAMIDAAVIESMKPSAWLVNVARGPLIAREPLVDALRRRAIGGAFLDVTDPEPLPPDDPLWTLPNAIVTMHLSGNAESHVWDRSAELFVANLERYLAGQPMENEVDLVRGY